MKKLENLLGDTDADDYYNHGIKKLENLLGDIDADDYYKPVLVRSSSKKIMNIMKAEEIKRKKKDQ